MTVHTMQEHERVTLHHGERDFRRRALNALAFRHVRGPEVLDLRCLAGHLSVRLARAGHSVSGLDAYPGAVEMTNALAKQHGLGEIAHLWDLTRLAARYEPARFDTVLCLDVLNHVHDDRATLADIATVLKPNARLVLAVPAFHLLLGARDRKLGHLRRYRKSELAELLSTEGFRVDAMRHWNTLALPLQFTWEHLLRRELGDSMRYGPENGLGALRNRILSAWYLTVENHVPAPIGITLFAVAHREP